LSVFHDALHIYYASKMENSKLFFYRDGAKGKKIMKWNDLSKLKPDESGFYLIYIPSYHRIFCGWWNNYAKKFEGYHVNVTHWINLPEYPQTENKKNPNEKEGR
jgi:plasmid maintenance system killer protein